MVEGGTDISVRDSTNSTSLHYAAAFNRHDSIVKVLLTLGADFGARDKMGVAPFHAAAALNPDVQRLVLLLQYGALLDTRDAKGITPLLSAASAHGEPRGRALPAEKGADPRVVAKSGATLCLLLEDNKKMDGTELLRFRMRLCNP